MVLFDALLKPEQDGTVKRERLPEKKTAVILITIL